MAKIPTQLLLSAREYDIVSELIQSNIDDSYQFRKQSKRARPTPKSHDHNAAAFRAATRVYFGTTLSLKAVEALLAQIKARRNPSAINTGLGIPRNRLALSLASLLFFHRISYRIFTRLRLQLLHEKVRDIKNRYPRIYAALTSRLAPAVGASLAGLSLGIYPAGQLRITATIYILVRALELVYQSIEAAGYLRRKPRWMGSWLIFALAQGQLLHSFVFDRDCFPEVYGNFIINNTHEYVQKKPEGMSDKVEWPSSKTIVTALAQTAHLNWPAFTSPILHPNRSDTLPPTISSAITPITSRAHPAIQHLSCALIHPTDPSCFIPYIRQILLSFPNLLRFFAMYYSALSLLSIESLYRTPGPFLNKLSQQIFKTTIAITGSIATAWGSICLFNNILPHRFMPESRFVLGGLLGGTFAIVDQGAAGHANAMYTLRTSMDSLWKVGKKRGWWKGIKGGDVWLFVGSLMAMNIVYDLHKNGKIGKDRSMGLVKVLRGEVELGLSDNDNNNNNNNGGSGEEKSKKV